MSLQETLAPNARQYVAGLSGKYVSTRLLIHNGVTIAFALGRAKESREFFFDYSILNSTDQDANEPKIPDVKGKPSDAAEILDSQSWFENLKSLHFSSEIRVVGEEAVPVYQIPPLDRTHSSINAADQPEKLDLWLSTSLGLMDPEVTNFEVLSDGRYIYLFRQSRAVSDKFPNQLMAKGEKELPPIDGNLLCDRFNLVGSNLGKTLEVRYRRSRQKRFPLNDSDTLAVRDINDVPFYEPTFSIRFIHDLVDGRFSILLTPTMTNDISRWMFFAFSKRSQQVECFTTDVASDGLFDIHGQLYYTCDSKYHEKTFSNAPGSCTAIQKPDNQICGQAKQAIVPKAALSERAVILDKDTLDAILFLQAPIHLSGPVFSEGFTLEAWVAPISFWLTKAEDVDEEAETPGTDSRLPPAGSSFCLFSQKVEDQQASPSVFIDERLRLVLRLTGETPVLLASDQSLEVDDWNHVAVTYTAITRAYTLAINGIASVSSPYVPPERSSPGSFAGLASQLGKSEHRFQGQLDEVRLWSHPLHPATIKARMSTRATGMEPLLEACWHFDEGTGTKAYDATRNGHDLNIVHKNCKASPPEVWAASTAPLVSNFGLAKRVLRLAPDVTVQGGLGAGVYHEQVSVSQVTSEDKKEDTKPLKRGARVLLCFVASKPGIKPSLAVLDFGLMSDGTLCDPPATLPLPALSLSASSVKDRAAQRASTPLLYVDAQGIEVFGGLLDFEAALCMTDSPCIWDSATGSITIYFRSVSGIFSALTYDISRSVVLCILSGLSELQRLLACNKLRQAEKFDIQTTPCTWAPEGVAIDLSLTATMMDGSKVSEKWMGRFHSLFFNTDATSKPKIFPLTCS